MDLPGTEIALNQLVQPANKFLPVLFGNYRPAQENDTGFSRDGTIFLRFKPLVRAVYLAERSQLYPELAECFDNFC
jgi:hypothetical protein